MATGSVDGMEYFCFLHRKRSSALSKNARVPSLGPMTASYETKRQHPYLPIPGGLLSTWRTGVEACTNGVKTSQVCAMVVGPAASKRQSAK